MIRNERLRLAVAVAALVAPVRVRRLLLTGLLGYDIASDAAVGRSLITVGQLVMGPGASIGSLNLFRHVDRVEMHAGASIGHLNWVSAARRSRGYFPRLDRRPSLVMRERSAITHRHYVDCCDRVEVGELSIVAGMHSQILTHGINVADGTLMAAPVRIGDRALVCSGAILVPGAVVPSRSVVGAGAVVKGALPEECTLYTGPSATARRTLGPAGRYFTREDAHLY